VLKRLAAVLASLALIVSAAPASAAGPGGQPGTSSGTSEGITVSWLPTTEAAQIVPGEKSTSTFWVTNDSDADVDVDVVPATAVPGNNGSMQIVSGADPRFPSIVLTPSTFLARAHSTTAVKATIVAPSDLQAGVYLLPAVVQPHSRSTGKGNVQIERSVAALTTYQLPGDVDISMDADFRETHGPAGTLVRKLFGLPAIEVGTQVLSTLRVTSYAASGIYAYYELHGSHAALGSLVFDGHTEGIDNDVRGDKSLYFNGVYREFPVAWSDGKLALGLDQVDASVFYNPSPSQVARIGGSMSVFVISPWWFAIPVLALLFVAWRLVRRTSKISGRGSGGHRRDPKKPVAAELNVPVTSSVVVGVLGVVFGLLADWVALGALGVLGILAGVATALLAPSRELAIAARRLTLFHLGAVLVLVASAVALAMTVSSDLTPGYALAGLSIGALWIVAGRLLNRWVGDRASATPPMELSLTD